jgi:hypothetical protein
MGDTNPAVFSITHGITTTQVQENKKAGGESGIQSGPLRQVLWFPIDGNNRRHYRYLPCITNRTCVTQRTLSNSNWPGHSMDGMDVFGLIPKENPSLGNCVDRP